MQDGNTAMNSHNENLPEGVDVNYMHTIPDSHYWTSIEMLINWAKMHSAFTSRERSVEHLIKGLENTLKNGYQILAAKPNDKEPEEKEKFKRPTDKQIIGFAILFNDGKVETKKLTDMVGMCQLIIDRLYENGDIVIPSSKENL